MLIVQFLEGTGNYLQLTVIQNVHNQPPAWMDVKAEIKSIMSHEKQMKSIELAKPLFINSMKICKVSLSGY